jgi:hypothetical protein
MKYAVEMGSGAMIYTYIPSLTNTGSGIQKLIGGGTHTQEADLISLLLIFQNKGSRLKMVKRKMALFRVRM